MVASKCYVVARNPLIIVQKKQFKINIVPIDMFGNRCATTLDDMRRLTLDVKKVRGFLFSKYIVRIT